MAGDPPTTDLEALIQISGQLDRAVALLGQIYQVMSVPATVGLDVLGSATAQQINPKEPGPGRGLRPPPPSKRR